MADGKLKRAVGRTPPNPPFQMPMKILGGVAAQRRLRTTAGPRSDPYSLHEPDAQDHKTRKRKPEFVAQFSPLKRRRQNQKESRAYNEQEEVFADPFEQEARSSAEQLRQEAIGRFPQATDAQQQGPRRSPRRTRNVSSEDIQASPSTSKQAQAAISVQDARTASSRAKIGHDGGSLSTEAERPPQKSFYKQASKKSTNAGAEQRSVEQGLPKRGRGRPTKPNPVSAKMKSSAGGAPQTTQQRTQRRSTRLQHGAIESRSADDYDDQISRRSTRQQPGEENPLQPVRGKLKAPQASARLRSRPSRSHDDGAAANSVASTLHTLDEVELESSQSKKQDHANNFRAVHGGRTNIERDDSPLFLPAEDREQPHLSSQAHGQRTTSNQEEPTDLDGQDTELLADETDSAADQDVPDDFYGQWHHLRLAIRSLATVGVNIVNGVPQPPNPIKMRDKRTKKLQRVCRKASEKFKSLGDSGDLNHDPVDELTRLREIVDVFKQDIPDRVEISTSVDLHRFAIPTTVRLLQNMIECYRNMDKDNANSTRGPITISHLREVTTLMELIVDLGKHASACPRPPTKFAVRKPIKVVLAHVGEALQGLRKVLNKHDSSHAEAADRARWHASQVQQEERDEAHRRQRQEAFQVRRKWASLHEERIAAEGGILCLSRAKMRHLLLPVSSYVWSIDSDGNVFTREELITTRAGPLPEHVEAARAKKWSMIELDALVTGLQKHQGDLVFEKIFREHCSRNVGILVNYSVTEIVTGAADLRDHLIRSRAQSGEALEDWLQDIPVWVRPRGPGAENLVGR